MMEEVEIAGLLVLGVQSKKASGWDLCGQYGGAYLETQG